MSATLHVEVTGAGPDIVLLHGWAMHGGVFDEIAQALAATHRVHCIDLPGHGRSGLDHEIRNVDDMVAAIAPQVPRNAVLLGWSLGGLLSLKLASSFKLRALVLVSTTPKFVADDSWPHGMETAAFTFFTTQLHRNFEGTVNDFLRLQVRGDSDAAHTLKLLKSRLLQHPASHEALQLGLDILRDSDERALFPQLSLPTLVLAGEHDRITHPDAAVYTAEHLPQARAHIFKRAGHAPFISHRQEFMLQLQSFLQELAI